MSRKILFIINPVAGKGKAKKVKDLILENIPLQYDTPGFLFTRYAGHALELSRDKATSYDVVVAVGGDGTMNEVANGLLVTDTIFGMIPMGSGNGLARHLKIPMDTDKALKILFEGKTRNVDTVRVNQKHFFNVAGVGFDAWIASLFATEDKRGLLKYIRIIAKEFFHSPTKKYTVVVDGETKEVNAMWISFANSPQYGNNAVISPRSVIDDGMFEVCIIKKFPVVYVPVFIWRLFTRSLHKSRYVEIISCKNVFLEQEDSLVHLDGEPVILGNTLDISIHPSSLKMVTGE